MGVRLTQGRELLLQCHVCGLHRIEPPLQHTRLMARVAELRLQRLDRTAVIGVASVGPLRGFVAFLLQLRGRAPLAVDLEQRALFRRAQALRRSFSASIWLSASMTSAAFKKIAA